MRKGRSAGAIAVLGYLARRLGEPLVRSGKQARRDQLAALSCKPGRIVLLGDSITHQGEWHELLPGLPVINRGVGGETSDEVLQRVSTVLNAPAAVSLLIGTNDLSAGTAHAQMAENVARILDEVERHAPGTPVVLNGIMPRKARFAREIQSANLLYREVASTRPTVRYLDTAEFLGDADGEILPALTYDGLHLSGAGYRAWVSRLEPALRAALGLDGSGLSSG